MFLCSKAASIEYKYVVSDWESPNLSGAEWEIGSHNRKVDLSLEKNYDVCGNVWLIKMTGGISTEYLSTSWANRVTLERRTSISWLEIFLSWVKHEIIQVGGKK